MPQISKVRIVNFAYNDGKRLIADELYDFASKDKDDALNVLINLANGGGKSVLVQLMMQPVLPKAKVAGRKIESFFNKVSDHCFVLLEWIKDDSTEKLLTGIAMAASESANTDEDSARGMAVKYYTFYANYAVYTSAYDIVNMPLSKKENGRFIAADYDAVRALAKKSNGVLNYYMSDDSVKWQKKLEEYGLIQSEWRMIEELNSEEGGLGKYFGKFKTSDQLVDKLLISTIESKLVQTQSKEDNSLSTMLISYAKQYASKKEVIREKEAYEAFAKELELLSPKAESLWNAHDALEICVRELFGFSDALSVKMEECRAEQGACEADIEELDQRALRIAHERASLAYYQALERFEQAAKVYAEADSAEKALQDQLDDTIHRRLVLECAEYYQKLLVVDGELTAIHGEITRRENGGENSRELAMLKYSVYARISELLAAYLPEEAELEARRGELAAQGSACENQCRQAERAYGRAKEEYTRADERLYSAQNETEREILKYGIDVVKRLDGYADEDIQDFQKIKLAEKQGLDDELVKTEGELAEVESELASIPQKRAELSLARSEKERACDSVREKLAEYETRESQIKGIYSEYNLDFSLRFTDHLKNYLLSEQRSNQARQAEVIRKISVAEEQIKSAKRGSLHVPYAVIDYLNSTGVRYSTCEKYLNQQVADGKLTNEECLIILQDYPAAAFGVLMDPTEKERFFAYGREKWLPAMIPLFTYEQMALILQHAKKYDGSIAFYSEEYFENTDVYIEDLEKNLRGLTDEQERVTNADEKIKVQLEAACSFAYNEHYEKEQRSAIASLEKSISEMDGKLGALAERETERLRTKATLKRLIQELADTVGRFSWVLEGVRSVLQRISEERSLEAVLQSKRHALEEAEKSYRELQERLKELKAALGLTEDRLGTLKNQISELNGIRDQIGECEQTEIVWGEWRELFARYQALQSSLDAELSELKSRLEDRRIRKQDYQNEIGGRDIPFDEYKNVTATSDQLAKVRGTEKALRSALTEATAKAKGALEQRGKTEGKLDSAKQALEKYGAPLDRSEVGSDFDARLKTVQAEKNARISRRNQCSKLESKINGTWGLVNARLKKHIRPEPVIKIQLEESFDGQLDRMTRAHEEAKDRLESASKLVSDALQSMRNQFVGSTGGVLDAIDRMVSLLSNEMRGDRYYTLYEHINGDKQNTARAISRIMTDLKEFENNHNDLIHQCVLQGERIYEGLTQMASSSRVTVYDGKDKKQMIRFDIPTEVDRVVATASIADEIDKGTKEIVSKMNDETSTEVEIRKMADKIIGSRNLLRKYIGREAIRVDAYKIDQNPQNAGYRSWEQTQVNNSGAEKFVVYFAVILSLMNYTRGDFGGIRDKDLRSTLILDNPFGATSSKHILVPMFAIAKHFRVQMVCLSDINKSDVINCFDIVIKAIVKKRPMSNNELLTHDGNESIEHGFYRSEQLSLL